MRFPASLQRIATGAFAGCVGITRVEFAEGADVQIDTEAFDRIRNFTMRIPATAGVKFTLYAESFGNTFLGATEVECTAAFFALNRKQFSETCVRLDVLPSAAGTVQPQPQRSAEAHLATVRRCVMDGLTAAVAATGLPFSKVLDLAAGLFVGGEIEVGGGEIGAAAGAAAPRAGFGFGFGFGRPRDDAVQQLY